MQPHPIARIRLPLIFLGGAVLLSILSAGCLVTSNTQQKRSGNYVSDTTFNQIEPGKTSGGFVRAILGQPTSISHLEDGSEIWKYSYTERKESNGAVFLIFGGHNVSETDHTAFIQVKNDTVTKAWRG